MVLFINASIIAFVIGLAFAVLTTVYFGYDVLLSLSPGVKLSLLYAASVVTLLIGFTDSSETVSIILIVLTGATYIVATGYLTREFDPSDAGIFFLLSFSAGVFIAIGYAFDEGVLALEWTTTATAAGVVVATVGVLVALDLSSYDLTLPVETESSGFGFPDDSGSSSGHGGGRPSLETPDIDPSSFEVLPDRIENGGFEQGTNHERENKVSELPGWDVTHGNTHTLMIQEDGIDGQSIRTRWQANSRNATSPALSQRVDLSGASALCIDAAGYDGNPHRAKIVLTVDGEQQGTFIVAPRERERYRDLCVELDDFEGTHTVTIKWVQIAGDNVGQSTIDNVRALR